MDDFKLAFEYLCQFVEEDIYIELIKELEIKIHRLTTNDIKSKQNLELCRDISISLDILKPIRF